MASGDDLQVSLTTNQIAIYLRDDLDYLAITLIPEEARYPFPPFYRMVWALILQNLHTVPLDELFRFALGLPRANAKTTFLKLLICYLLIHDYDISFFLIVCATEPLAENFLSDVDEMMKSPVIAQVYGSWEAAKTRDTKKIKRSEWQGKKIILAAIGAQTSLRGLNIGNRRPQLILCDDVQTKENDESSTERAQLLRWLLGTLFKARAKVEKSAILYIGNMYSTDCILYLFSKLPNWTSLITGSIMADGSILWPELNTLKELLEEYAHDAALGEGATWFAEVQNDPVGASTGLLDIGESVPQFKASEPADYEIFPTRFITVDPAGAKVTSDDNVVATHVLKDRDELATLDIKNGKWNPTKVIQEIIRQAIYWKVGIVFIESQGYQASLAFWLDEALKTIGLEITVIPLPTGTASKYRRIKAWVKQFAANKWEIADLDAYNKLTFQLFAYRTNRTDNVDDILDVQAQAVLAMNKHYTDIIHSTYTETEADEYANVPVVNNNSFLDRLKG